MNSVKAIGSDIVDVARIRAGLDRYGDRFRERLFTAAERRYCDARKTPAVHYAGRFAAKEAVLKVLHAGFVAGVGLEGGASFRDVEVERQSSGRPVVLLHGPLLEAARRAGIEEILLSISHTREQAVAFAMGQGPP